MANSVPIWYPWLGLPHKIDADPRYDGAVSCLKMVELIYEEYGVPHNPISDEWYTLAYNNQWDDLYEVFHYNTREDIKQLYNLVPFHTSRSFGLGIVVEDDMILTPHHRQGLIVLPISSLKDLTFYRPV